MLAKFILRGIDLDLNVDNIYYFFYHHSIYGAHKWPQEMAGVWVVGWIKFFDLVGSGGMCYDGLKNEFVEI